jgi:hypothetical protein
VGAACPFTRRLFFLDEFLLDELLLPGFVDALFGSAGLTAEPVVVELFAE